MWGLQSKVFRGWQMSSRKACCQRSCRYNRYGKTQCGLRGPGAEDEKRKRQKVCEREREREKERERERP